MGAFLNYTDNQGIMLNTYSKRLNAKIAYDANPTTWLSTAVNLAVNHTWGNSTPEDGGGTGRSSYYDRDGSLDAGSIRWKVYFY